MRQRRDKLTEEMMEGHRQEKGHGSKVRDFFVVAFVLSSGVGVADVVVVVRRALSARARELTCTCLLV